jgi:macrolide-specific efflux system membrane fusion protein
MAIAETTSLKSRLTETAQNLFHRLQLAELLTRAKAAARTHRWALILGGSALMLGLGYLAYTAESTAAPEYTTAIVTKGDIEDTVTAVGNLQPRDYVDVGAQVSGQLKKLYVQIGDTVKKGQLLAEIDPQVLDAKVEADKADLENIKAQLSDKQAQVALANANFSRQKRLMAADATSRTDYESALQAARSAAAQVDALKAQMAAAQSKLDGDVVTLGYTKVYAPMDGTVVSVAAKQGQTLNANQTAPIIMRVADLSTMTVWTQVSEADVPKLKIGQEAYFTTLGEPNKRYIGKLTQIQPTPEVVNNVVLYTATFDVANPNKTLMTQMTAQVFFVTASAHDVLTVPVAALHQRPASAVSDSVSGSEDAKPAQHHRNRAGGKGKYAAANREAMQADDEARAMVLVMLPDGSVERRRIVVGVSNRVSAAVLSGLEPGEKVVVGRQQSGAVPAANDRGSRRQGGRSRGARL